MVHIKFDIVHSMVAKRRNRPPPDFLDEVVAEFTARDPAFPKLFAAAKERCKLGRRLTVYREKLGLSQAEIASRIKTSQAQVSRIEAGADARLSTLGRYAAAVGCDLLLGVRRRRATAA